MRKPRVREEVEAGEAERAEAEEPQAAALEPEGLTPLPPGEHREQQRGRDGIANRRQGERVDPVQRGRPDDELASPCETGDRAEDRAECCRASHPITPWCHISITIEMNEAPSPFIRRSSKRCSKRETAEHAAA